MKAKDVQIKLGSYTVEIQKGNSYLWITHQDFPQCGYEIKLTDEGLIIDAVSKDSIEAICAVVNTEVFECDEDCDE